MQTPHHAGPDGRLSEPRGERLPVAFRQNAVSRATWPWQAGAAAPAPGGTRRRALARAGVTAAAAAVCALLDAPRLALAATAAGLVLLLAGLVAPPAFRALDRALNGVSRAAGAALTWLLLAPFFVLCFVPGRLALMLGGKDPLRRRRAPASGTYWVPCRRPRSADGYRKQY